MSIMDKLLPLGLLFWTPVRWTLEPGLETRELARAFFSTPWKEAGNIDLQEINLPNLERLGYGVQVVCRKIKPIAHVGPSL